MRRQVLLVWLLGIASALAALVAPAVVFGQETNGILGPPAVNVKTIASRQSLERDESTLLFVIVSNESGVPLQNLRLSVLAEAFVVDEPSGPPATLPAFGSISQSLTIRPTKNADFTQHAILVLAEYVWGDAEARFESVQSSTATVTVKRKFEDELGGLLGGGAAALYFLLPLYPAVAAYQLIEQRRRGEELRIPAFGRQHVVPAAIASLAANLLVRFVFGVDDTEDLLEVGNFFAVVGLSVALGALVPIVLTVRGWWREQRWGYSGQESVSEILRKALTGPQKPPYKWVTLTSGGESWEGMLLEERGDCFVLGAQLKASARPPATADSIKESVLQEDGTVLNPRRLIRLVEAESIHVTPIARILSGNQTQPGLVRVERGTFQRQREESRPLIRLVI
jgi:hypothetical protein